MKQLHLVIMCVFMSAFLLAQGGLPPEKLYKKAEKYFADEKWEQAKKIYSHLLENCADNAQVKSSAISIQERIMRCDFYTDEYDFAKIMQEEYGVKNFRVKEGRLPYVEMTFDFDSEESGKLFGGGEVRGGVLAQQGSSWMGSAIHFRDPFSMEIKTDAIGGNGLLIAFFVKENFRGEQENYFVAFGKGPGYPAGAVLFGDKKLQEQRSANMQIDGRSPIKLSKVRGKLIVQGGKLRMTAQHNKINSGFIYFGSWGGSGLRIDSIKIKSHLDPQWWSSFKGDVEGGKWIPFKSKYAEKYGEFKGTEGKTEGENDEEKANKLSTMVIFKEAVDGKFAEVTEEELETINSAMKLLFEKKYNQAETKLNSFISSKTDNYIGYYLRGLVRMENSNTEGAVEDLKKAAELAPEIAAIPFAQGVLNMRKKEYSAAVGYFKKTTGLDKEFTAAYVYECLSMFYDDDITGAQKQMEIHAAEFPDDEVMQAGRKMFYLLKNGPEWVATYKSEGAHYIVYSEISQASANEVKNHIEGVYNQYARFFPYTKKSKDKYKVFVFNSFGSFADYAIDSGEMPPHPGIGGLYHPLLDHLLIRGDRPKHQMLGTVYHEGLHQYLEYYIKDAPIWFNEGLATFFEASYFDQRGFKAGVLNKKRLEVLKAALEGKVREASIMKLKDLMLADNSDFMEGMGNQVLVNYSHSWSLMYFMLTNKEIMDKFLRPYFKMMTKGANKEEAFEQTFAPHIYTIEKMWKDYYLQEKYN